MLFKLKILPWNRFFWIHEKWFFPGCAYWCEQMAHFKLYFLLNIELHLLYVVIKRFEHETHDFHFFGTCVFNDITFCQREWNQIWFDFVLCDCMMTKLNQSQTDTSVWILNTKCQWKDDNWASVFHTERDDSKSTGYMWNIIYSFTMLGLKSCLTVLVSSSAYSAYRPVICRHTNKYIWQQKRLYFWNYRNLYLFIYFQYTSIQLLQEQMSISYKHRSKCDTHWGGLCSAKFIYLKTPFVTDLSVQVEIHFYHQ